jgi:restriction endonuclease
MVAQMTDTAEHECRPKHDEAITEAASHLATLLPAEGTGLTWADVMEDNDLAGQWAPSAADLRGSVLTLIRRPYEQDGAPAAVRLIESAARLASHRHRNTVSSDVFRMFAQLEVYVRMLGVDYSPVMAQIKWEEAGPALTGMSPGEVRVMDFDLAPLRRMFERLQAAANRQKAGLKLERLLWRLFDLFRLEPGEGFRLVGEQVDARFRLHKATWLLESKWTRKPMSKAGLASFKATVESKSTATRGLFISIAGYSAQALEWAQRNQRPAFLMLDGNHLRAVLDGKERLDTMLDRLAAEFDATGEPYRPLRPDVE